jgi:predicted amidohydrolase YtcJ
MVCKLRIAGRIVLLTSLRHQSAGVAWRKEPLSMMHGLTPTAAVLAGLFFGLLPLRADGPADQIYTGGHIVTMDDAKPVAEAVAVHVGKILAVGTTAEVMKHRGDSTLVIDLKGNALLPGFIDPHSHIVQVAAKLATANLSPPPIGPVDSIAKLKEVLREYKKSKRLQPGQWILGMGYDNTALRENRHPTRYDLDDVSSDNPIFLLHISCHLAALNSRALELAKITADTADPQGGKIHRQKGTREPDGVLEEHALLAAAKVLPKPSPKQAAEMIRAAFKSYASRGITTAQEGAASPGIVDALRSLARTRKLPLDVVAFPLYLTAEKDLAGYKNDRLYTNGFRLGGIKFILDGSVQGYTCFLSQPYYIQPGETTPTNCPCTSDEAARIVLSEAKGGEGESLPDAPKSEYRGYPAFEDQTGLNALIFTAIRKGWPILAHTNGDAATDQLITAVRAALKIHPVEDHRTTIIHAQTMREDQLDEAKKLGMLPSFFPGHIYYWGDRHRDIFLGPKRAVRISPAASAVRRGMRFTLHNDAPVLPEDMLNNVWCAVNRVTRSGKVLGADQRIAVRDALKAITIHAAWQYFEEDRKGSIKPGKLADFVILADNPLTIESMKIKDIRVLETIKEGVTIYRAE